HYSSLASACQAWDFVGDQPFSGGPAARRAVSSSLWRGKQPALMVGSSLRRQLSARCQRGRQRMYACSEICVKRGEPVITMLWQEPQGQTGDLFAATDAESAARAVERHGPGTVLLRGFARPRVDALLPSLGEVLACAPFRHLVTPGGLRMAVAMSNCG